ncbi:MAPK/MAK/MRK overlapping kinase-like isoform X1 [Corythoichthys intestinalis]|uniref:MAPK/MAK/MRK overlapping kinase-like isoform X1 n=1 Tax=Corythoichthys intestinalis TaxID=161448 RepID=UPI0025A58616|nr:MAPK/MAK/MRK overlapping kinase-like isoform X1 [Corythoichthys intestinalis]XP_061798912.1 MAPK/MAK/MRK overlapping kinase-like [Nerophis lumbriciformis]
MLHYSNWLIGVKNRANLRNACKTSGNSDWTNRSQEPGDKTGELAVTAHLWKKGYKIIKKIGEGSFSVVVKTQSLKDGKIYACKTMKQTFNSVEQANNLREVQAMRRLSPHANIIHLHELIFDKETGTVSLICELMEMNIYEYIREKQTPPSDHTVKHYMYQLCKSLDHMHSCGIFHRDVKPENILIKQNTLKLGDFGSCRSVYSKPPHTEYISTRWYRAPECLLTDGYYSLKMDIWSAGCVFFEIMSLNPLFPGANELDQIAKIHDVLGTPDQSVLRKFKQSRAMHFNFPAKKGSGISRLLPNCAAPAVSLLYQMLAYDADERITAATALRHTYFRELRLAEKKSESNAGVCGLLECVQKNASHVTSDLLWRPTRLSKQMRGRHTRPTPLITHNPKHVAEPLGRRNGTHYQLPKIKLSVPGPQRSFPGPTAFAFNHRGALPAIAAKKCQSRLAKTDHESEQADLETDFMPPLDRKHEGDY